MPDRPASVRSPSILERVLYLKMLDRDADLRSADLAVVAELSKERFFAKGAVLYRDGEPVEKLQLIVEGSVEVAYGGLKVAEMSHGDALGWLTYLARDSRGLMAQAKTDVRTLEIDAEAMMEVLEDRFSLTYGFLKGLCRRLLAALVESPWAFQSLRSLELPAPPRAEMDFVERLGFLRQARLFQHTSINSLAELSRSLNEVRFDAGTEIWHRGDVSGSYFLVIEGAVTCRAVERAIDFGFGPGAPLGALESLAEMPRFYDATTKTPIWALHGSTEALLDVFEDNFEMATEFLSVTAADIIRIARVRAGVIGATETMPALWGTGAGEGASKPA